MKRWPWDLIIFLGVGFAVLFGAFLWSGNQASPHGVQTVAQYWERFGEPSHVFAVERDGKRFFWVRGRISFIHGLALPSDAPAYIFTSDGQFVEWCYDPGDSPSFNRKWGRKYAPSEEMKLEAFRQRFALPTRL